MSGLTEYFERHEEQAFVAKALLLVFCIVLLQNLLSWLIPLLLLFLPLVFLLYIRFEAAAAGVSSFSLLKEHITLIPVMRTEADRKVEVVPWLTYSLILINIIVYLGLQCTGLLPASFIENNLLFLPCAPNAWNLVVSPFSSMFLHGSAGHLWGNMTFLWMVGTAVERRLGDMRFLAVYLVTGIIGGLVFAAVEFLFHGKAGHALGASGAIAGIMGVFAVRCYFKSMIFPIPLLGIFSLVIPLNLKVRLNSLVIIGLFFLADLSGGMEQITSQSMSNVGHWAHLGGMISGMLIAAFYLKVGDAAVEERHLEAGVKASHAAVGYADGERSLAIALEKNPDNWEATLALARLKTRGAATEEGAGLYERAVRLLLAGQRPEAVEVFNEFYGKYFRGFDAELLNRIATVCRRSNDTATLLRCLELILKRPDAGRDLRGNALYQMAATLEGLGNEEARGYYLKYLREFPDSERTAFLMQKLGLSELPKPAPERRRVAPPVAEVEDHTLVTLAPVSPQTPRCPNCGAVMVRRRVSQGPRAGEHFQVCLEYPRCRTALPVTDAAEPPPPPPMRQAVPEQSARPTRGTGRYRLVFNGQIDCYHEHEDVVRNLSALLKMEQARTQALFSGKRFVLKDNVSREQAEKAKLVVEETGALLLMEEIQEEIPEPELTEVTCPKCGKVQDASDDCVQCGVVFEKYAAYLELQEQKRMAAQLDEERRLNEERERHSSLLIDGYVWRRVALNLCRLLPFLLMVYAFHAKYNGPYQGEGFSVKFPGTPQRETTAAPEYTISIYELWTAQGAYYVGSYQFFQEVKAEEMLDKVRDELVKEATLVSEVKGSLDGYPARSLVWKSEGRTTRWKICMAGKTLYQFGAVPAGEGEVADAEEFIDSFQLKQDRTTSAM